MERCRRCGGESEPRFCATCGADLRPDEPLLPTADSIEAAARAREWLSAHPEAAAREPAPSPPEAGTRAPRRVPLDPYRELGRRGLAARALLVGVIGLSIVSVVVDGIHISVIGGPNVDPVVAEASLARVAFVDIAILVGYLLAAIAFIAWLFRAHTNIGALGEHVPRYGRGWAIGGWFVPILSFWRPKQVIDDVWKTSDPDLPARGPDAWRWTSRPVAGFVHWWWALFVAAEVLDSIGARMFARAVTADAERSAMIVSLLAAFAAVGSGLLAVRLITRITQRQRERTDLLAAPPPTGAPRLSDALAAPPAGS